jgi:HEAT repeat protein
MQKRANLLVGMLCAPLASVVAILLLHRNDEPTYQGRTLTQWYHTWFRAEGGFPEKRYSKADAANAISKIGTNAVPLLLNQIRSDPNLHLRASTTQRLIYALPFELAHTRVAESLRLSTEPLDPRVIFRMLGPEARPAIPELTHLLLTTTNIDSIDAAVSCLAYIGEEGFYPLVGALADSRRPCCGQVAYRLGAYYQWYSGTNLALVVPALANLATNANLFVAFHSAEALGVIRLKPEIAIPSLTDALHHPAFPVRHAAICALTRFGDKARPAAPSLAEALRDPNLDVRTVANNLLLQIAPEALTNRADIRAN